MGDERAPEADGGLGRHGSARTLPGGVDDPAVTIPVVGTPVAWAPAWSPAAAPPVAGEPVAEAPRYRWEPPAPAATAFPPAVEAGTAPDSWARTPGAATMPIDEGGRPRRRRVPATEDLPRRRRRGTVVAIGALAVLAVGGAAAAVALTRGGSTPASSSVSAPRIGGSPTAAAPAVRPGVASATAPASAAPSLAPSPTPTAAARAIDGTYRVTLAQDGRGFGGQGPCHGGQVFSIALSRPRPGTLLLTTAGGASASGSYDAQTGRFTVADESGGGFVSSRFDGKDGLSGTFVTVIGAGGCAYDYTGQRVG